MHARVLSAVAKKPVYPDPSFRRIGLEAENSRTMMLLTVKSISVMKRLVSRKR